MAKIVILVHANLDQNRNYNRHPEDTEVTILYGKIVNGVS